MAWAQTPRIRTASDRCMVIPMTDPGGPFGAWERHFREQLVRLRESKGLTQTDVARMLRGAYGLAFHQQTIQRIESGERPIRLNEAHLIAQLFDVPLEAMTSAGPSLDREVRQAVEGFRGRCGQAADQIESTMTQLGVAAVRILVDVLGNRLPDASEDRPLDDVTLWGLAWAGKAKQAFDHMRTAYVALRQIEGKPAGDTSPVLDETGRLARWLDRYPNVLAAADVPADELFSAYQGEPFRWESDDA